MIGVFRMSKYFTLDNKNIFLWGNTNFAERICKKLENDGYSLSGIIEKNGSSFGDIRLIEFDEIKKTYEKNSVVLILCLKSSLNQERLADELYREGFLNLILAPLTMGNRNVSFGMRDNYQNLLYGGQKISLFPKFDLLLEKDVGYRVLKWIGVNLEVLVDIKYLRTFYRNSVEDELLRFRDKHISEYDYLNELYDYLYNNGQYPQNYMTVYMKGMKNEDFLTDRRNLYNSFREGKRIFGWRFFDSIPIPVECKENGLNIKDGMHRASFLYKEGAKNVPVLMTCADFITFVNMNFKENQ